METVEHVYAYDELGQLSSAIIGGVTNEYTYDPNGNRKSETVDGVDVQSFADFQDRIEFYGDIRYEQANDPAIRRRFSPALRSTNPKCARRAVPFE